MSLLAQSISKPHGKFFSNLLDELFKQATREQIDYTYEPEVNLFDLQSTASQFFKAHANVSGDCQWNVCIGAV